MNNMNTLVNFEMAKKLKEKGFNERCNSGYWYNKLNPIIINDATLSNGQKQMYDGEKILALAPTISDVVMWIYNTYNIWISVNMFDYNNKVIFEYILYKNNINNVDYINKNAIYNSPTEAYLGAIEYILNND